MKSSSIKYSLIFVLSLFLSISLLAEPFPIKKGVVNRNLTESSVCCSVVLAECCEFVSDFEAKKINALKALESGCGKEVSLHYGGDYEYHDFIFDGQAVARLVVNEKEKVLMLVMIKFKNRK